MQKRCKSQTGYIVQQNALNSSTRDLSAKTIGDSFADSVLTQKAFNHFRAQRANYTSDQKITTQNTESQTFQRLKAQNFKQTQNISIMMTGNKIQESQKCTDGTTSQATKFEPKFKNRIGTNFKAETPQPSQRQMKDQRSSQMTNEAYSSVNRQKTGIDSGFKPNATHRSNFNIRNLLNTEPYHNRVMSEIKLEEIIKTNKIGQPPSEPMIIREQPLESQATSALLKKLRDVKILREADQTQFSSCNNYSALDFYDQQSSPSASEGTFKSLNRGDQDCLTEINYNSRPDFFKLNLSKVDQEKRLARIIKASVRRGQHKLVDFPKQKTAKFDLPTELFEVKNETQRDALMGREKKKYIDKLKYQRLYNSLYFLPLILAPDLDPEEDRNFAIGCNLMLQGKYKKAIQHLKMTENEFESETFSNSQSHVISEDSQNKSGTLETSVSLKRELEQDMVSFDSELANIKLNKTAFDLQLVKERFNPDGTMIKRQSTVKVELTFQQVRRHMYYFNIAVCYAKCGYTQKALQTIMTVTYADFQAVADFNKAIFELLDKKQDLEQALFYITSAIQKLEKDPPREWLIIDDIKHRMSFILLFLRERFVKKVDPVELDIQVHQFKLSQLKYQVVEKDKKDFLEHFKMVDRLLIRTALIKPNGVLQMLPQARKEFALFTKYLEGVRINSSRQLLSQESARVEKPIKSSSKFNLEMKLDGLNVKLPFENVPFLGANSGKMEQEESPLKNDVLQRLSARSLKKDKRNAIKRAKSQMAESRRKIQIEKAKQSAIKMNPLNEQYLGIKQSAKTLRLLKLGQDQSQDYWIGMSGCLQKAYDSSVVGHNFDTVNIRTKSEAAQQIRIQKELLRIQKMSIRDIQKAVGLAYPEVETENVEEGSSKTKSTKKVLQGIVDLNFQKPKYDQSLFIKRPERSNSSNEYILDISSLKLIKDEKAQRNYNTAQVSLTQEKKDQSNNTSSFPLRRYDKSGYAYIKEYSSSSDSDNGLSELQSRIASLESNKNTITSQKISKNSQEPSAPISSTQKSVIFKPHKEYGTSVHTPKNETNKDDEKRVDDGIYEIKIEHEDIDQILERQYINTSIQFYKLNLMLNDPAKFKKLQLTLAYEDVADRISSIRRQTKFASELARFQKVMNMPQLQNETSQQIVKSLQTAFDVYTEVPFYTDRLRNSEIQKIIKYKADVSHGRICDFREIHRSLNKLTWFSAVSYQTQQLILNKSKIGVHKEGDILIKQGQANQTVFVVIRGVIQVTTTRYDWGTDVTTVLKSVYDGAVFGETASFEMDDQYRVLAKKYLSTQKYTFTVQEPSIILSINQKDLNTLRQNNLAEEFADRLQFLQQVDLFQGIQLENLLPIAHNIVCKKFKLGQLLLKAGEVPEGLIIIKSGYCKVGLDKLQVMNIANEEFTWNRNKPTKFKFAGNFMTPMRQMNFKRMDEMDEVQKLKEYQKTHYQLDFNQQIISNQSQLRKKMRIFAPQTKKLDKNYNIPPPGQKVVQQFVEFFSLQKRQHYGGRILLDDLSLKEIDEDSQSDENFNHIGRIPPYKPELVPKYQFKPAEPEKCPKQSVMNGYGVKFPPSLLTVVADSADVEVLIIDRVQLSLVSDSIQRFLVARLQESVSIERPYSQTDLEKIKMQKERDITVQQALVKEVYIKNFYERMGCSLQR